MSRSRAAALRAPARSPALAILVALIALVASSVFVAGRSGAEEAAASTGAAGTDAAGGGAAAPRVRLETSLGDIVLELDRERAPESVENFLAYVEDGFYDGTVFHRVIEDFMIQGGGFTEDYRRKPTRGEIRNEADNRLPNRRYTIAMARTNAPHSATSQFFVNTADNANLDHTASDMRGWGYAVFGKVVDGFDVVDTINEVATGPGGPFSSDAPTEPVTIEHAELVDAAGNADAADAPDAAAGDDTDG